MQLPIGISDFRKLIEYRNPLNQKESYLYVDKSLFIKEILGDGAEVIILTRPRRFGKTLNLSMLYYFYSNSVHEANTAELFKHLAIAKESDSMHYQGKYPTIFITLKDLKYTRYEECMAKLRWIMSETYKRFRHELSSDKIPAEDKAYIDTLISGKPDTVQLEMSLKKLLDLLYTYYGIKPILLIDEYDTPIQQAYVHGYFDQVIAFFRNFLSVTLKDSTNLEKGILTGILRISKESLFSDLNNVKVYSILNEKYAQYFGFTDKEVDGLLEKSDLQVNREHIKSWYNGYRFDHQLLYNPWSIINCIAEKGTIRPYWINTSGNDLIRLLVIKSDASTQEKIAALLAGESIKEMVDFHIVFRDLHKNRSAIWGLFLMSGYLKALSVEYTIDGDLCELALPNKEIESLFRKISREWLSGDKGFMWYQALLADLTEGRVEDFEAKLQDAIYDMASYHDTNKRTQETFYHGMMLGILAGLKDTHEVKSNRESGRGRYDLIIIPHDPSKLSIIMEFKSVQADTHLESAADNALVQIIQSNYMTELKQRGLTYICPMGIAFSGKDIKVKTTLTK